MNKIISLIISGKLSDNTDCAADLEIILQCNGCHDNCDV